MRPTAQVGPLTTVCKRKTDSNGPTDNQQVSVWPQFPDLKPMVGYIFLQGRGRSVQIAFLRRLLIFFLFSKNRILISNIKLLSLLNCVFLSFSLDKFIKTSIFYEKRIQG